MTNDHKAKTTVIVLPEGITNRQIRLTDRIEPGVGGTPTVTAIDERKLLQARQPLAGNAVSQLAVGGVLA